MPRVGDRTFPYTSAGRHAAEAYARETGQVVEDAYGGSRRDQMPHRNDYTRAMQDIYDRREARNPSPQRSNILPTDHPPGQLRRRPQRINLGDNVYGTWGSGSANRMRDPDVPLRHKEFGPYGYADETRKEHEDRLWDRDWDEDWRGHKWHPERDEERERAVRLQMRHVLEGLSPEEQMDPRAVSRMVDAVNQRARRG